MRPVLLVMPPLTMGGFERFVPRPLVRPPLGLLLLASALRRAGRLTHVLDLTARPLSPRRFSAELRRIQPSVVGFYTNSITPKAATRLIAACRSVSPVVVGGPGTFRPLPFLQAGASFAVRGECDATIGAIVDAAEQGRVPEGIPGAVWLGPDGALSRVSPMPGPDDLSALPFPDWDAVDLGDYHDRIVFAARSPYFSVIASRGCPRACTFCFNGNDPQQRYRCRTAQSTLDELEQLVTRRGVGHVAFQDDIFGQKPGWVEELCEGIIDRRLRLTWSVILHPTSFRGRRREILPLMKRAGLVSIGFGAQSASPEVLRRARRSAKEPQLLAEILEEAHRLRIMTAIEYIFGLPGDTEQTMEENIRFACSSAATLANFHDLVVFDGIPIADMVRRGEADLPPKQAVRRALLSALTRFYTNPSRIRRILTYAGRGLATRYLKGLAL